MGAPSTRRRSRCRSRSGPSGTERGRRTCLPRGIRPRGRRPGPRLRRHRRRRGGGSGRVRRGGPALARDWASAEPGGLDHHDRAQPRDRPLPPRGGARGEARAGGAGCARRAGGDGPGGRRPTAADLHHLPPVARARRAGRAHAAAARRADDGRDRARVPRPRADDGAAARARQGQDPRREDPVPRPARGRPAGAPEDGAGRRLPDLQRRAHGQRRRRAGARGAVRGGDPARAPAGRADARRARGARPAGADAADRRPPRRRASARRASSCCSPTRTARSGTTDKIAEGHALVRRLLRRDQPGPYQLQAAINAVHSDPPTDWAQVVALYDQLLAFTPTPVVALNRAVAIAEVARPAGGARARRRRSSSSTTTSSTPSAPTCCAGWTARTRRARPTRPRSRARTTPPSASSCARGSTSPRRSSP